MLTLPICKHENPFQLPIVCQEDDSKYAESCYFKLLASFNSIQKEWEKVWQKWKWKGNVKTFDVKLSEKVKICVKGLRMDPLKRSESARSLNRMLNWPRWCLLMLLPRRLKSFKNILKDTYFESFNSFILDVEKVTRKMTKKNVHMTQLMMTLKKP